MEKSELEDYIAKYRDNFNESFPYFLVRGMSEKEMIKIIKESLESNKPFKPEIEPDCYY